jgi:hypothetical protein
MWLAFPAIRLPLGWTSFSEVAFVDDHNASALLLRVSLPSIPGNAREAGWLVPEVFAGDSGSVFGHLTCPQSVNKSGTDSSLVSLPDEV